MRGRSNSPVNVKKSHPVLPCARGERRNSISAILKNVALSKTLGRATHFRAFTESDHTAGGLIILQHIAD
jgi:hypothetical protein